MKRKLYCVKCTNVSEVESVSDNKFVYTCAKCGTENDIRFFDSTEEFERATGTKLEDYLVWDGQNSDAK